MSEENTQAVVEETNTQPVAGSEGTSARNEGDDLDAILKEFDTAHKDVATSKPEPTPGAEPDLKVLKQQVESLVGEANATRYRQDMDKTIADVRGDLDPDLADNDLIEAWLDTQARKDPRLARAWTERNTNPKQFDRVKTELGKKFREKFAKMPDKNATEDREAVTAAVRGASNRAPESKAPDYSKLSDAELQREKDKLFGG